MRLDHPLDDLFRSRSHIRVLRALDELPDRLAVSVRDLARRSGLSHPTVSSALKLMLVQGVVLARRSARADAFEVNRQHVLVKKMRRLFEWERSARRQFLHFLQKQIESHGKAVGAAFVFEGATRSEMTATSDVDVAIVCPPGRVEETEAAMGKVAEAVRKRFGNRLSMIIGGSPLEQLGRPGHKGYRLWARILKEGVPLVA